MKILLILYDESTFIYSEKTNLFSIRCFNVFYAESMNEINTRRASEDGDKIIFSTKDFSKFSMYYLD